MEVVAHLSESYRDVARTRIRGGERAAGRSAGVVTVLLAALTGWAGTVPVHLSWTDDPHTTLSVAWERESAGRGTVRYGATTNYSHSVSDCGGYWEYDYAVPSNASGRVVCAFHDSAQTNWHNNYEYNWQALLGRFAVNPSEPIAGQVVTVRYDKVVGPLAASTQIYAHIGFNDWAVTEEDDTPLTYDAGRDRWSCTVLLPSYAEKLNLAFHDGTTYDNNYGMDWSIAVTGAYKATPWTPLPVMWPGTPVLSPPPTPGPMDLAIVFGDEYGDRPDDASFSYAGYDFGQGIYYIGTNSATFSPVVGARLSQFDGSNQTPCVSANDDGNRRTDRWEASLPWSSLNAPSGVDSLDAILVAGIIGSSSVVSNDRYLSSTFIGQLAYGDHEHLYRRRSGRRNFLFHQGNLRAVAVMRALPKRF